MATLDLIADLLLLGASVVALALMLWRDARGVQQCGFSSAAFYRLVTDTEEYLTVRRIVLLVVLVASATVMAMASAYVVMLLAVAVLAVDVAAWCGRPRQQGALSGRARRLLAVTLVVLLAVAVAVALTSGLYYGAVATLGMAAFSYGPAVAANWLLSLLAQKNEN